MAVIQRVNDEPSSLSPQHPSTRVDTHVTNSGSVVASASGGGPARFPRREHSLNIREAGHSVTRDWNPKHTQQRSPTLPSPSLSHSSSNYATHRPNPGEYPYDQRHYHSSTSTASSVNPTNQVIHDPRLRTGYVRDPSTSSSRIPSPPVSPRWDSLLNTSDTVYGQATTSTPSSPVTLNFANDLSYAVNEPHRSIDSVASETRDEFPTLLSAKPIAAETPMLVENFSRPRLPSIKQPFNDGPRMRSPIQPQSETSPHDTANTFVGPWPRSRGPSISSNKSVSTFASLAVRPSYDSHTRDSPRGRVRQPLPPPIRLPVSYARAESSGPGSTRDPIPRMASLPNDELRSSFRSQLSASTAQGTLTTERSSLLTKSSSVTSIYGTVDDSLSVDDVLGLYDKGFDDDSAAEDNEFNESRPHTAISESSKEKTTELDIVTEVVPLDVPPPVFDNSGPIVRDSAAIFRISNHEPTPSETATIQIERPDIAEAMQPNSPEEFIPPAPVRHETNLTTTGDDERDRYGFKKSNQYITSEQYDRWDNDYSKYLARRRRKWNTFLKENGLMTDSPNRFPPRSAKAKRFIRKGIPPDWRGAAWFYYAGGPAIVAKHAGLYGELLDCEVKEVDVEAIERDLHRTFPDNIRFRSSANPGTPDQAVASGRNSQHTVTSTANNATVPGETAMISSLRRVLYAFSVYNPRIGYCQSLNFLAGLLLLFVESEEQAFWLLNIITRVYLPGTHEMSLEGANVDLGVLMSSIRDTMPNVWAKIGGELDGTDAARPKSRRHRQRAELTTRLPPITLCMTAWFMSCFIGTLPIESTLRVWDVFFYEGSKTLFRIALTIFKLGEPEIKKVGDPMEIFQVVQTIPRKIIDVNGLMEACYKRRNGFGHLSQEAIEQKRLERRKYVKAEKDLLASGESIVSADAEVGRKGTLFKRKPRDRNPPNLST
ncbi:RabGAP/TBC [Xylaria arbuscula]|nr:RabGAP/TBC [Xylaria arbuscula]